MRPTRLLIVDSPFFGDASAKLLSERMPTLESLSLCGLPLLSDAGVGLLPGGLPALRELQLLRLPRVTRACLPALIGTGPSPPYDATAAEGAEAAAAMVVGLPHGFVVVMVDDLQGGQVEENELGFGAFLAAEVEAAAAAGGGAQGGHGDALDADEAVAWGAAAAENDAAGDAEVLAPQVLPAQVEIAGALGVAAAGEAPPGAVAAAVTGPPVEAQLASSSDGGRRGGGQGAANAERDADGRAFPSSLVDITISRCSISRVECAAINDEVIARRRQKRNGQQGQGQAEDEPGWRPAREVCVEWEEFTEANPSLLDEHAFSS